MKNTDTLAYCPTPATAAANRRTGPRWQPLTWLLLAAPLIAHAQFGFEDVTSAAGTIGQSATWGSTVGDYNGDGWDDIFVTAHQRYPRWYRNNADGTFSEVARELDPGIWFIDPVNDQHAAGFGDVDNDGDLDLLVSVSATGPAQLLINQGGTFSEMAADADVDSDGTARQPLWFDYDNDGYLDLAALTSGPTRMFRRDPSDPNLDFDGDTNGSGVFTVRRINYGQLIDVAGSDRLEFVLAFEGQFPSKVFDTSTRPFVDVTASLPSVGNVNDSIPGDFDGDLRNDIFLVRGGVHPSGATLIGSNRIEAWITRPGSGSKGFTFTSAGPITASIDHSGLGGSFQPSEVLALDPTGPTSGTAGDVSVSYNASQTEWTVSIPASASERAYIVIETGQPASQPVLFGLDSNEFAAAPRLISNKASGAEVDFGAGFDEDLRCASAVAGDFNNDMWLDLYLICRDGIENIANRLYENLGGGVFQLVPNAAGAEGPIGVGLESGIGVADSVALTDYDNDGFLDLFITNGAMFRPWGMGGRDTLLRNLGNSNHWVQFELQGTTSNRDGIGAKVYVTAGGTEQLREHNSGHHRVTQDSQRLHFGLAGNLSLDVTVHWPSGNIDTHTGVAADAIYRVIESGAIQPRALGPVIDSTLPAGSECGAPSLDAKYVRGLWLWKDCTTDRWQLRSTSADNAAPLQFDGRVESSANITNVSGANLEAADSVGPGSAPTVGFAFTTGGVDRDGMNFKLASGATGCLHLDNPPDEWLYVGPNVQPVTMPFDLTTLGPCTTDVSISISDLSVDEGAGMATVTISLSEPASGGSVFVDYSTADDTATAGQDYTATNGTAEILDGQSSTTFDVPLLDDSLVEGDETVLLSLSNPQGALLGQASATLTLLDNEGSVCGEPSYDKATEIGLFLWRDCEAAGPDALWQVRVTGGGGPTITYDGVISADMTLSASPERLEGNDTLDSTPGDGVVDYALIVGGAGFDGFGLTVPAGAETCFGAETLPAGANVYVGAARQVLTAPFSLATLGPCAADVSITDLSVDEDAGAGVATVTVSLSAPASGSSVFVDYATADGTATAGLDYTATNGTAEILVGQSSTTFDVPLLDDSLIEGDETVLLSLSNPQGTLLGQANATLTLNDDEGVVCGEPTIDRAVDLALFVWRDCEAAGTGAVWQVRVTAGGSATTLTYEGLAAADPVTTVLSSTGFSLEPPFDVVDSVSGDHEIDYVLKLKGMGIDGFEMTVPSGATMCFDASTLPSGASVLVGANRQPVTAPFDLDTLQVCI